MTHFQPTLWAVLLNLETLSVIGKRMFPFLIKLFVGTPNIRLVNHSIRSYDISIIKFVVLEDASPAIAVISKVNSRTLSVTILPVAEVLPLIVEISSKPMWNTVVRPVNWFAFLLLHLDKLSTHTRLFLQALDLALIGLFVMIMSLPILRY